MKIYLNISIIKNLIENQRVPLKKPRGGLIYMSISTKHIERYALLPMELKQINSWVLWDANKIPKYKSDGRLLNASISVRDTWTSFEDASTSLEESPEAKGIGFVFDMSNDLCFIDIDHCISDDGEMSQESTELIKLFNSCTERSQSGKGLHIFFKGDKDYIYKLLGKYGTKNALKGIELYINKRYCAVTGNISKKYPSIRSVDNETIKIFVQRYLQPKISFSSNGFTQENINEILKSKGLTKSPRLSNKDILNIIKRSKNSEAVMGLYNAVAKFLSSDDSSNDQALCNHLAFYTQNMEQIIEMINESSLYRDKFNRSDYLPRTIIRAIENLELCYTKYDVALDYKLSSIVSDEIQKKLQQLQPHLKYSYGDAGNGKLFSDVFGDIARYNATAGKWYIYNGKVWIKDIADIIVIEMAIELKENLLVYGASIKDEAKRITYLKHVAKMENRHIRDNMIKDARGKRYFYSEDLDSNQDLLNLFNGTLNLKTFKFMEHNAKDLLSRIANVEYKPKAFSYQWAKFIDEVMQGDQSKIDYLQKAIGYGITADTSLETCFILYGATTRNGKSTLVETIMYMLGGNAGYAMQMRPESLAQRQNMDSRQASGDIARLDGCRFLNVSEPPKRMIFDSALLKALTGGDKIAARHLHEREFEFMPHFKLFMNTNYLPMIQDDLLFNSNRINIISFNKHFSEAEQDKGLKKKLKTPENLSGILNWCLEGLKNFYAKGLKQTATITADTAKYREDSDKVGTFIKECLEKDQGNIKADTVYTIYKDWCQAWGYGCENKTNFYRELKAKGVFSKTGTINGKSLYNVIKGYKINTSHM